MTVTVLPHFWLYRGKTIMQYSWWRNGLYLQLGEVLPTLTVYWDIR